MASSTSLKRQPEVVADKVLKRAELGKMARRLQNRLALAQFKTKHGVEDLTLDALEPRFEEARRRRKRLSDADILSDSSSSTSELPYPSRTLMSSPLKAGPLFSDALNSSGTGSTGGHRKRTYMASFDSSTHHHLQSSPSKRFRSSPTAHKSFNHSGYGGSSSAWRDHNQLAQSSPIKPRRQQHFTTSTGPDVSLYRGSSRIMEALAASPNYHAALSDDEDDLLPAHSFVRPDATSSGSGAASAAASSALLRSSPPRTPPMRNRSLNRISKDNNNNNNIRHDDRRGGGGGGEGDEAAIKSGGEEGADLLLYLAASPSPANPISKSSRSLLMEPPSTPPPRSSALALPSSMMTTPGGRELFPQTPSQTFDFSDFVHITPSPAPAQKGWKTPVFGGGGGRTPLSAARRRLTFGEQP